jgi:Holliday junction resolvasome RuvABC endonuclease subunit
MIVFGMDIGFVKTGFAVIELVGPEEKLLFATTLTSGLAKEKKTDDYVAIQDAMTCFRALTKWEEMFKEFKPKAAFCEIPSAGAQGARANRCMGMATALIAAFLHKHDMKFELFIPSQVEEALGIKLTPGDAKKKGLNKTERTAWKKERLEYAAMTAFPDFKKWPDSKATKEDACDATCAFLAGRQVSQLYNELKGKVSKEYFDDSAA